MVSCVESACLVSSVPRCAESLPLSVRLRRATAQTARRDPGCHVPVFFGTQDGHRDVFR